jgi:hypothetical protein
MPISPDQWTKPTDAEKERLDLLDADVMQAMQDAPPNRTDEREFYYNSSSRSQKKKADSPDVRSLTERERRFFTAMWMKVGWESVEVDTQSNRIIFRRVVR